MHPLVVSEKYYDHQDHMLLVVPGVSFKHFALYDPSTYSPFVQGDKYYMWGNPGLITDQYREGYVTGSVMPIDDERDAEDIDVVSPYAMLSGPVAGGDSGSAVFRADGKLAGVLTYGIDFGMFSGVYPLAFTSAQVDQAEGRGTFVYLPDTRPVTNVTVTTPAPAPAPAKDYSMHILIVCLFLCYKFRSILSAAGRAVKAHVNFVKRALAYIGRAALRVFKAVKEV